MLAAPDQRDQPRRGRPLDARTEAAIREAALDGLSEVGYDALTIEMVAGRARAGKGAIYRRWSSKLALVIDALGDLRVGVDFSGSDSVVAALTAWASAPTDDRATRIATGLFTAATRDPVLADALRRRILPDRDSPVYRVLELAKERGEIGEHVDIDLVLDLIPAVLLFRSALRGDTDHEAVRARIVHSILLPALGVRAPTDR
jgi:AcrR family transcriptional regulator